MKVGSGHVACNNNLAQHFNIPRQTLQHAAAQGRFGDSMAVGIDGEIDLYSLDAVSRWVSAYRARQKRRTKRQTKRLS